VWEGELWRIALHLQEENPAWLCGGLRGRIWDDPMESLKSRRWLAVLALLLVVAGGWYIARPKGGAIDFSLVDIDGEAFWLSDFKGRVVLLDFMATWCGPCRMSMSDLSEIRTHFGEDIVIISISIDPISDTVEQLMSWRDTWEADWIHARDIADPPLSQRFQVSFIPTTFIIDKDGEIGFKHVGLTPVSTLKSEISELLSK
jgi:thiol-disulfide isomerase/thioredoxin